MGRLRPVGIPGRGGGGYAGGAPSAGSSARAEGVREVATVPNAVKLEPFWAPGGASSASGSGSIVQAWPGNRGFSRSHDGCFTARGNPTSLT